MEWKKRMKFQDFRINMKEILKKENANITMAYPVLSKVCDQWGYLVRFLYKTDLGAGEEKIYTASMIKHWSCSLLQMIENLQFSSGYSDGHKKDHWDLLTWVQLKCLMLISEMKPRIMGWYFKIRVERIWDYMIVQITQLEILAICLPGNLTIKDDFCVIEDVNLEIVLVSITMR